MRPGEKVVEIIRRLKKEYPKAKTALDFGTPFELLIATILSAQTTDVHVNRVTERLFKEYKTIGDYAKTPLETLTKEVSSINFYRTKAKNIKACAGLITKEFGSEVPRTMEGLVSLPGVARKTANIVLSNAFGINEGIAVDTHVKRLSGRLGLTENEDPVKIEQDLLAVTPKKDRGVISNLLILHGRKICIARGPRHGQCVLYDICPSNDI